MKNFLVCFFIFSTTLLQAKTVEFSAPAPLKLKLSDFSETEKSQLESGEMLLLRQAVEGKTWSKNQLYALLDSTPLEAAAFYGAYEHQKNYIPGLLKSAPIQVKSSKEVIVAYERSMPWPLENSHYVTGNLIENPSPRQYKISWYQVSSDSTLETTGMAWFTPWEKNKTLFSYEGFVEPKSSLGSLFRDLAVKNLKEALETTIKETDKCKKENSSKLKEFVDLFESSLKGKNPYGKRLTKQPHAA